MARRAADGASQSASDRAAAASIRRAKRFNTVTRAAVRPFYRSLTPVAIVGAEHLPPSGPVILAANHISFFDTIVLMLSVPRRTFFVGKAEYLDSLLTRYVFPALGLIPIERSVARRALEALDTAASVLRAGEVLAIYPEGTRSRDGLLHRGHTGVAQLALATGAPVVPVGLVGTDRIQPVGARVPRPFRRASARFGPAIDPKAYGGPMRRRRQALTRDLMEAIRQLSGQPASPDFAAAEPPLIRGGSESVYEVRRLVAHGASWHHAARLAVAHACRHHDDARVGEVRRVGCAIEPSGSIRFVTEMTVSVKIRANGGTG